MNHTASNVISLSARKNTSGLSDEHEEELAKTAARIWQRVCADCTHIPYSEPVIVGHVVLPHGDDDYEITLPLENGDVTYFRTVGGLGSPERDLVVKYMGRELAEAQ